MRVLRKGGDGEDVRQWQLFLIGQGILDSRADGLFGPITERATKAFQKRARLTTDGVVGPMTYAAALERGFNPGFTDAQGGQEGLDWPSRPSFKPLLGQPARSAVFGRFNYEPVGPNTEDIRILDNWPAENLTSVTVPLLRGVEGAPTSGRIRVHRLVAAQTQNLFAAWQAAGLARFVLAWAGGYAPRFIRGSRSTLSSHAWGTAFDINAPWNPLAAVPARRGAKGSVRDLVPIAHEHGFYWGGHFSRSDGMHFEVARVL